MISRNLPYDRHADGTLGAELQKYADPMLLPSRSKIPHSFSEILLFCRWLYISNPHFRQAVIRMVAHGVTRLKFHGDVGSPKERKRLARKFREVIGGMRSLRKMGEDFVAYGTAACRIYYPFTRQLVDRRSGTARTISLNAIPEGLVTFDLRTLTYRVPDPLRKDLPWEARPRVNFPFRDIKKRTFEGIQIRRLDPRFIKFRYASWAGDRQVQYSFEPEFKQRINRGELFEINRTPLDILRCVRDKRDYLFKPGAVFCMVNETISGFLEHGFGLPEPVTAFPILYKIALYDRLDESISHEMMTPYRFISPAEMPAQGVIHGGEFRNMVRLGVEEQRMDRTRISSVPIPLNYQEIGGNGKNLVPKDLKDYETQQLFNAIGIPAELFTASISMDMIPYAMRLFEASHADLFEGLSGAANWAVDGITEFMYGEAYDATLEPSSVADDMNRRAMLRDLYSAQEIPRRVLMDSLNLDDALGLKKERAEEDIQTQEDIAQLEEQARRRAELGSIDNLLGGAAPGQASATPVDVMDQASALAMEWLSMPDGQRHQAMQAVAAQNRQLYAMAKDIMEQQRRAGESQGRQMVYQQAQQTVAAP